MAKFEVGDGAWKESGDYHIGGEVRSVFTKKNGAVRVVVEHKAEGGGSFLHIYGEDNLVPMPKRDVADGFDKG